MTAAPQAFDHYWRCAKCDCSVKHFLGICWKCGAGRPGGETARQTSLQRERGTLAQPWSVQVDVVRDLPQQYVEQYQRDVERHLRRIDLARSIVLTSAAHITGSTVIKGMGTIVIKGEECRSEQFLQDYYGEGYHGELHHADCGELVMFVLMYKSHELGANAVLNVTITPSPTNNACGYAVSGDAVVIENG